MHNMPDAHTMCNHGHGAAVSNMCSVAECQQAESASNQSKPPWQAI
jgi:hypothetical protein